MHREPKSFSLVAIPRNIRNNANYSGVIAHLRNLALTLVFLLRRLAFALSSWFIIV